MSTYETELGELGEFGETNEFGEAGFGETGAPGEFGEFGEAGFGETGGPGEFGEIEAPVFPVLVLAVQQIVLARIHGQIGKIGIEFEVERVIEIPRHPQAVPDHRPVQQIVAIEPERDVLGLEILQPAGRKQ